MLMLGQGQFTSGEEAANLSKADQSGEEAGFRAFADTARRRWLTVKSGIADEYIDRYNCHNHSNRGNYHDPRSPSDDGAPESGRVAQ